MARQVAPPGSQIINQYKQCHLVAKSVANTSSNDPVDKFTFKEVTGFANSIAWVCCASGIVSGRAMFTHTLCAFEPKFAHTLCANKHFHVPKLFFCLQPSYPNFYHIWCWFVPPLTSSGSGCLGRGSLGGNTAQIRTHPQNLQEEEDPQNLPRRQRFTKLARPLVFTNKSARRIFKIYPDCFLCQYLYII